MGFIIDKQTLNDLCIFGKRGSGSVYNLFNGMHTKGGASLLEEWFLYPLDQAEQINKRSQMIRFFQEQQLAFPFQGELLDAVEFYLSNRDRRNRIATDDNELQRKVKEYIGANPEYKTLHKGLVACIRLIGSLRDLLQAIQCCGDKNPFLQECCEISGILDSEEWQWMKAEQEGKKMSYEKTVAYDEALRFGQPEKLLRILSFIYLLDVCMTVARTAVNRGFCTALAVDSEANVIDIRGLYHPGIENPVANDIHIDSEHNTVFLTGANMAGKSTFMKSLGIAVFLAHAGFPVPAKSMTFAVQNGLYTTINLPDNISLGYSHFYAEVLRVKRVAVQVVRYPRMFVIFDELFRGTNVQDAYEATVAVTRAFAGCRESTFVISTHIIEAGEALRQKVPGIRFVYLPTSMKAGKPEYTYRLTSGISNDRQGMVIINNEKILEILREGLK